MGLVNSLDDFYIAARTVLVKSERYFDLYDQAFAHQFRESNLKKETNLNWTIWLGLYWKNG